MMGWTVSLAAAEVVLLLASVTTQRYCRPSRLSWAITESWWVSTPDSGTPAAGNAFHEPPSSVENSQRYVSVPTPLAETVKVAVMPTGMAAFCGDETVGPGMAPATTFTLDRAMGVKVSNASVPCWSLIVPPLSTRGETMAMPSASLSAAVSV